MDIHAISIADVVVHRHTPHCEAMGPPGHNGGHFPKCCYSWSMSSMIMPDIAASYLTKIDQFLLIADRSCRNRHRSKQRSVDNIPSSIPCYACVWCFVGHTKCNLLTRPAIGPIGLVHHWNYPLCFLWIQFAWRCSEDSNIFEVYVKIDNFFESVNWYWHIFVFRFRYTTFIILYPTGVTGELLCLYWAQDYASKNTIWSIEFPNVANFTFSYYYFLWIVMLLYIPLFPQLYLHMFALRKKVLGASVSNLAKCK